MMRRVPLAIVALVAFAAAALLLLRPGAPREVRATLSLADAMGTGDTIGWRRALEPRPFTFPGDHGPHSDYRTEWWYFTGNVDTPDGRRFGFQLTFFRSGLTAAPAHRTSAWAADQAYMAHFAVTDADGGRFFAYDRFARAAVGLAGARAEPFRVWLHDWEAVSTGASTFPLELRARQDSLELRLVLEAGKPIVRNGEEGLSRKGGSPGNATYYYSLTRLPARGTIAVGPATHRVEGEAWLDREWGTSALEPGQTGWDWFALQLSDSTELMLYRLRRADGMPDEWGGGTFVDARGTATRLEADDIAIEALAEWQSPLDGARYPAAWRVEVPAAALVLRVEPVLANQELNLAVRYWEGAVDARGTRAGAPVAGRGYVELTGYAGEPLADRARPPP